MCVCARCFLVVLGNWIFFGALIRPNSAWLWKCRKRNFVSKQSDFIKHIAMIEASSTKSCNKLPNQPPRFINLSKSNFHKLHHTGWSHYGPRKKTTSRNNSASIFGKTFRRKWVMISSLWWNLEAGTRLRKAVKCFWKSFFLLSLSLSDTCFIFYFFGELHELSTFSAGE